MFYFTDKGWQLFEKKISYKETIEVYDTTSEPYTNKESLIIEDITLTEEQQKRFETVKNIKSVGVEDIRKYVFEAKVDDPELIELHSAIRQEQTRQKLLLLLQSDSLTAEEKADVEKMLGGEMV